MDIDILVMRFSANTIRIKHDNNGCIIFDSNGNLVRADSTTWEILKMLNDGMQLNSIIVYLSGKYRMPILRIEKDAGDLSEMLLECFSISL